MRFEPEQIALKKFVVRWRGYDTQEVEAFLRAVAEDFRRVLDQAAEGDGARSAPAGDELADVRDELKTLLARVDVAIDRLEGTGQPDPAEQAELRLVRGEAVGG
jgi:DivIVA domain-containing protein